MADQSRHSSGPDLQDQVGRGTEISVLLIAQIMPDLIPLNYCTFLSYFLPHAASTIIRLTANSGSSPKNGLSTTEAGVVYISNRIESQGRNRS